MFQIHFGGSHDFPHGKHLDEVTVDIRCHIIEMCYHVKSLDAHQCRITCMKCMHRLTHLIKLTYFKHVSIFFQEKHFGGSSDFSHVNLLDEVKTDIRRRLIDIDTKRQVPEFHQRRTT